MIERLHNYHIFMRKITKNIVRLCRLINHKNIDFTFNYFIVTSLQKIPNLDKPIEI